MAEMLIKIPKNDISMNMDVEGVGFSGGACTREIESLLKTLNAKTLSRKPKVQEVAICRKIKR